MDPQINTFSSFATVRNHTTKLEKQSLNIIINSREKEQEDRKEESPEKWGTSYLEITTAFHKMNITFKNRIQSSSSQSAKAISHLDVDFSHMTAASPILR